jgi:hypothetical protein
MRIVTNREAVCPIYFMCYLCDQIFIHDQLPPIKSFCK